MAAYRRVYDTSHLQADYHEPEAAPEPYARQSSWATFTFVLYAILLSVRTARSTEIV